MHKYCCLEAGPWVSTFACIFQPISSGIILQTCVTHILISPREQVLGWLKAVVIQYCQNELLAEKWKFKTCIRLITVASNNQIVNFVQSSLFDIHKVVRMVVNLTKWGIQYMFRIFLLFLFDNQSRSWPKKFVSGFSQKSLSITSAKKSPFLASAQKKSVSGFSQQNSSPASAQKVWLRLSQKSSSLASAKNVHLWLQPKRFVYNFSQKSPFLASAKKS